MKQVDCYTNFNSDSFISTLNRMFVFKALNTFKIVPIVTFLVLRSNFEICDFCTPINLPSWVDRLIRIVRKSSSADQNPWHVAVPSSHYKTFEDVFIVLLHELRHNFSLNILYLDSTPYLMGPADLLHLEMAIDFSKYLGFYHERFQKNVSREIYKW